MPAPVAPRDRLILLVDDEPSILQAFSVILGEWGRPRGVAVRTASSAAGALEALAREPEAVDLVVADLNMPVMRGSDLLLAVKERYPQVVTMIVSGVGDLEEMRKVIGAGVFSYLMKPCPAAVLLGEAEKALELARLRRENRRHEQRLREELQWAGELQRTLLRSDPVRDPALEVSITYLPLPELQCGGDYYEVTSLSPSRSRFLIGDVGGHGIRAALVAAMLKAFVSACPADRSPARLLEDLNRRVCAELKRLPDLIITFLACLLDSSAMTLSCANAGHIPLFVLRGPQALRVLPEGMGLGFSPQAAYAESVVALQRGDRVVLGTDGLLEGLAPSPAEAEAAFTGILRECGAREDFNAAVVQKARRDRQGFRDDAALLSVRIR
jgi:sigma-B regulation protein RsbU (phosphoserine phosphatase)